ncbi:MAG: sensor histidine kinase [Cytophagales bacterium]|nr:MAG: sensor histidine kinase [Cytophagales bacterium]
MQSKFKQGDSVLYLEYRHNNAIISFSTRSPNPLYSYRVGALFEQTITTCDSFIVLPNLPNGELLFEVRDARQPTEKPARLKIIVEAPLWLRWWFLPMMFLYGLVFVSALLYLFYRYRIRQFLRLQQTRDRIARDLHDDMGSYLSSISILSRSAALNTTRDPDRAQQSIERIGQTARQVMGAMSDIVWSINPDHDSMEKVVARMRDVANELFADTGTTVSLDADPTVLSLSLPLEKRHDFFLIFKEALTNTARYAEATQVRVRLQREGATLLLIIQDNGRGFDVARPKASSGGGNGLKNMHKRAENIGGTLQINSVAGQGTTVTLVV